MVNRIVLTVIPPGVRRLAAALKAQASLRTPKTTFLLLDLQVPDQGLRHGQPDRLHDHPSWSAAACRRFESAGKPAHSKT
jgi:hypothetical protein